MQSISGSSWPCHACTKTERLLSKLILGNPRHWSFSGNKKLLHKNTALHILESGQVVDKYSRLVHSSCSERSLFPRGSEYPIIWYCGCGVVVIIVQASGKYMSIWFLDP